MGIFDADDPLERENQLGLQGDDHAFLQFQLLSGVEEGELVQLEADTVSDEPDALGAAPHEVIAIALPGRLLQGEIVDRPGRHAGFGHEFDLLLQFQHGGVGCNQFIRQPAQGEDAGVVR